MRLDAVVSAVVGVVGLALAPRIAEMSGTTAAAFDDDFLPVGTGHIPLADIAPWAVFASGVALILLVIAYLVILLPVSIAARLIEKKVRRGGFGN